MPTNIHTLIEQSLLLGPMRKKFLIQELSKFDEDGLSALADLMQREPVLIAEACEQVITHAVKAGNMEWLKTLDAYLHESAKKFHKAEEGATDSDEDAQLAHFFDDAA